MDKILVISNDLDIGGIQKSLIDFLDYLVSEGKSIDLLLWQKNGVLQEKIPAEVNVMHFEHIKPFTEILKEKKLLLKIKLVKDHFKFSFYSKILKKPWLYFPKIENHYNIVVSYSQNGYPRFYTIDCVSADQKYLWYHHGSYESTGETHKSDQKYYAKFNCIATVSLANKEMLIKHFPEINDKFCVVPNIINVDEIILKSKEKVSDFSVKNDIFNFVTVSRFSKEKGIDLSIEIALKLKEQGLKFKWYFVGDGDTFSEIKMLVKHLNLENECILLGIKKNPYPYIKLADLYIQTSYVESQSITIYEALVLKKMIVTTNLATLREALQHGKLGKLCEPKADSFVDHITTLLNDNDTRNDLQKALANFNVSNGFAYGAIKELF